MQSLTIILPDGFNGDFLEFNGEISERDESGRLVKVYCVVPGKEYLFRWVHIDDFNRAKLKERFKNRKQIDSFDTDFCEHLNED